MSNYEILRNDVVVPLLVAASALSLPKEKATGPAISAGPAGRCQFAGFQMMTFFVASSPGAGATLP